ncbi:MAG TPA: hypothetical protein VEY69_08695, partial [Lautropia sp.]|nr:hypothetical protein [Lautropia sp.]
MIRILPAASALALALVAYAPTSHAQGAAIPPALAPESRELVDAFMAAANGDGAAREAFMTRHVARVTLLPREALSDLIRGLQAAGGIRLVRATPHPTGTRLMVAAANGRTSRIDLAASDEPGKVAALLAVAVPTPAPDLEITGPLPRAQLAAAIDRRVRF